MPSIPKRRRQHTTFSNPNVPLQTREYALAGISGMLRSLAGAQGAFTSRGAKPKGLNLMLLGLTTKQTNKQTKQHESPRMMTSTSLCISHYVCLYASSSHHHTSRSTIITIIIHHVWHSWCRMCVVCFGALACLCMCVCVCVVIVVCEVTFTARCIHMRMRVTWLRVFSVCACDAVRVCVCVRVRVRGLLPCRLACDTSAADVRCVRKPQSSNARH